ncbi:MAG: hypothetical protein AAF961_11915 [Planctomycetota bacterium]
MQPLEYPMSGYYYQRGATGVLDPLQAKAIVFDVGQVEAAIVVSDLIGISTDLCRLVRDRAAKSTGIPAENLMVTATHCHTGPDYHNELWQYVQRVDNQGKAPSGYADSLVTRMSRAVERAAARRMPASLEVGAGTEATVAVNRRFVTCDGSVRTWGNYRDPSVLRAAGPIDSSFDIFVIGRATTREPVAALSVLSLHLDTTAGTEFSADSPFQMERAIQSKLGSDFLSVFAAGTCGDINHVNPRSKDRN